MTVCTEREREREGRDLVSVGMDGYVYVGKRIEGERGERGVERRRGEGRGEGEERSEFSAVDGVSM